MGGGVEVAGVLDPPHPITPPRTARPRMLKSIAPRQRRRGSRPRKNRAASAMPELVHGRVCSAEADAAVVVTVRVAETGVAAASCACDGVTEQVGASVGVSLPGKATAQVRLTAPLKPLTEAI